MIEFSSVVAVLALMVSVAAPFLKAVAERKKEQSGVQLVDAQTITEWVNARSSMQKQINDLSDELYEARQMIGAMRADYERQIAEIRDESEKQIRLLRRRVNRYAAQMRRHGIEPDDSEDE